jgi:hypothetical protein
MGYCISEFLRERFAIFASCDSAFACKTAGDAFLSHFVQELFDHTGCSALDAIDASPRISI